MLFIYIKIAWMMSHNCLDDESQLQFPLYFLFLPSMASIVSRLLIFYGQAGISRVVVGIRHPLQHLRGKAIQALRSKGVQVDVLGEDLRSKIFEVIKICNQFTSVTLWCFNTLLSTLVYISSFSIIQRGSHLSFSPCTFFFFFPF